jgi:hypothetical protein
MLTINGHNRAYDAPQVIIPEEQDVELGEYDFAWQFQPYENAFTGKYAIASNLSQQQNIAHAVLELPNPTDHHDFKKSLYPSTYDYLADDVAPDGVHIDSDAYIKWGNIVSEDLALDNFIQEVQNAEYNYQIDMDKATNDPILQSKIHEAFKNNIAEKTKTNFAVRVSDATLWIAKVFVASGFAQHFYVAASRVISDAIIRTMHSFRSVLENPAAYIPQDVLAQIYTFVQNMRGREPPQEDRPRPHQD